MRTRLPSKLRPFFWDYDFARLSWKADRDLIIARILAVGNWDSIRWLCRRVSDLELREWLIRRRGAELGKKSLRLWELLLKLPHREVNAWLADPDRRIWNEREALDLKKYDFWSQRDD